MRIITGLAIVLLLGGCRTKGKNDAPPQQMGANQPALSVEAYIVKPQSLDDLVEVPGSILPFESTEIHPEVSGRIVMLNINEGNFVKKGSLLARIYDGDLQAQLKKLEVQLDIAKQNEKRSAQLLKIQGISQADYDLSLLNVNNINADIEITKADISKTVILAPFNGKLGLKNISPGAFVTPTTVITTIGQVDQLKLQFTVPEKYGSELKKGQDIQFSVDGSQKVFHANIAASEIAIAEDTRSLLVRAVIKGQDPDLIPGAFAKVKIVMGATDDAIMIPNSAIVPLGRKKQSFLYRAGKAVPVDITTGIRDSSNVQVLTGINAGDTLLTTGLLFLRPGIDVKISKITPEIEGGKGDVAH